MIYKFFLDVEFLQQWFKVAFTSTISRQQMQSEATASIHRLLHFNWMWKFSQIMLSGIPEVVYLNWVAKVHVIAPLPSNFVGKLKKLENKIDGKLIFGDFKM